MQIMLKQIFLAAALSTLFAVPALARKAAAGHEAGRDTMPSASRQTAGEAASLEKKETGTDAEELSSHQDNSHKVTTVSTHKNRVATAHPKAAAVRQTASPQHSTAKLKTGQLKTGQLTSGQSAKLQTKQTAMHHDARQAADDNGGHQSADEKTKADPQSKTSNDIRLKKHNARMF